MNFHHTVTTGKTFEETFQSVQLAIENTGFRILHVHDVQQTLKEKGFIREPLKIIEFCNAKHASEALEADINISLWLPCKINIYTNGGETSISYMPPSFISQFFPQEALVEKFKQLDEVIKNIVELAK